MERVLAVLRLWFGLRAPVTRRAYAVSGVALTLVKYAAEVSAILALGGRWMTPLEFVSPLAGTRQAVLAGTPEWTGWALFAWNLPFVWIAVSMSVRRAALAGLSPWVGLVVLAPFLNFLAMAFLATLPDGPAARWAPDARPAPPPLPTDEPRRSLRALGAAVAVGAVTFLVVVNGLGDYAASFFLGAPLAMGAVAGFLYNRPDPRPLAHTLVLGVLVMAIAGGFLLLFAFEGLICLAMAVPIVVPLAVLGAALGKGVADATRSRPAQVLPLALLLPLVAGAESLVTSLPEYCVLTTVEVDAPPEAVWRHVVAFADIPPPTDWFFRAGVACPMRARIEGSGVGAVRHCEFTTGDFVEPITAWDEPRRLAFDVVAQPDPMIELSPWGHVHPPHLRDRSLASRRGEFRLVDLGRGRTRLEGRTWYTFAMHPQAYWTLWSDMSIHKIHRRVLEHVKSLAEADSR